MKLFGYILFRLIAALFWLIPFWLLYRISNGIAWLLYRVIGYRKEVVVSNLKRCFPERGEKEIETIAWKSYLNLSDIILETIKSFTMPVAAVEKRYVFKNAEDINKFTDQNQPVLICGSHFNNWEWGVLTANIDFTGQAIGVYKPLKNKGINNYFNRKRMRAGMQLIPMKQTFDYVANHLNKPNAYFFITDQSPANKARIHWVDFMGNDTACLSGVDTLARKFNMPVFHYEVNRIKRGYYEVEYTEVCLDPSDQKEGEITQQFMNTLAAALRRAPESWLWSHKRWKKKREPELSK